MRFIEIILSRETLLAQPPALIEIVICMPNSAHPENSPIDVFDGDSHLHDVTFLQLSTFHPRVTSGKLAESKLNRRRIVAILLKSRSKDLPEARCLAFGDPLARFVMVTFVRNLQLLCKAVAEWGY